MENDLENFNADKVKTPEVKPASEVSWEVDSTAHITFSKECIVCNMEFSNKKNEAGLCPRCKQEMNLLIKNR